MGFIHKHGQAMTMQGCDEGHGVGGITVIRGMHQHGAHDRLGDGGQVLERSLQTLRRHRTGMSTIRQEWNG